MSQSNSAGAGTRDSSSEYVEARQFLTFTLAREDYGVDILRVQEIRGWNEVRTIPNTPTYVKGVLNLRGSIVPIIDLRARFRLEKVEYTPTTVIIVLAVETDDGRRTMGIVVDAVSDVLDVRAEDFKKSPSFGTKVDTRFMDGMVVVDERMVILLNADRLLDPEQISELDALR